MKRPGLGIWTCSFWNVIQQRIIIYQNVIDQNFTEWNVVVKQIDQSRPIRVDATEPWVDCGGLIGCLDEERE